MKLKKLEITYPLLGGPTTNTFYDVEFTVTKKLAEEMAVALNKTEFAMLAEALNNNRPADNDSELKEQGILALEQLKRLTGKTFRAYNTKGQPTRNLKLILYILKDGWTLREVLQVIDYKGNRWLYNSQMKKYLRPETLFNKTKFESYLQECQG
jgi:uncharacterized phage protein (TIGR02220 family)